MTSAKGGRCCHIIAAGPQAGPVRIDSTDGDLVIAADGGMALCERQALAADVLIGDFDSFSRKAVPAGVREVVELPRAKDDTDTIAAVREGLSRGCTEFHIHAAFGGDVGHELAVLQTLALCRRRGVEAYAHGNGQTAFIVTPADGRRLLQVSRKTRVSVFAFGGTAYGVTERGLRWELDDAVLEPDYPLGVSNEATCDDASVSVREGMVLVVTGTPNRL